MKAISLWQPWASLVANGTKTIETRSWSTKYRGRLAIHAAKSMVGLDEVALGVIGGDASARSCWRGIGSYFDDPDQRLTDRIPRGAVVATCELVDVVPIFGVFGNCSSDDAPPVHIRAAWNKDGDITELRWHDHDAPGPFGYRSERQHEDQLPYGDFSPGRFAWLLADVLPLPDPVPLRGRQGLWNWDERPAV